jgi:hypothetical protein
MLQVVGYRRVKPNLMKVLIWEQLAIENDVHAIVFK